MGKIIIKNEFSTDKEAYTHDSVIEATDDNKTMSQLLSNDEYLKKQLDNIELITYADIDAIDGTVVALPDDYEGDVTDSDIDNILNN